MPPLAADLSATPVWHRADVERVAAADGQPRSFGSADTVKVVGTAEAALILDVHKSQIGRWRRTKAGGFPEPCAELLAGPLWWRKDITAFKRVRATKRRRAAKRKAATA